MAPGSFVPLLSLSVEEVIYVACHQRNYAAIDDLGAIVEVVAHTLGAVLGVNDKALREDAHALLGKGRRDHISAVVGLLDGAARYDLALLEVKIAERLRQGLIKHTREQIALEFARDESAAVGDKVVFLAVLLKLVDEVHIDHFVKRLGKIEVHYVIVLHNDIVQCNVIQGVIYILHQVKHKNFNVSFISDTRSHNSPFPACRRHISILLSTYIFYHSF